MSITRRNLLRRIGAVAAGTTMAPSWAEASRKASRLESLAAPDASRSAGPLRLNRNENAYGPSAAAIATMQEAAGTVANRYADVDSEALRNRIAALHRVTSEQVALGCGASEILRMAADAFVGSGNRLIVAAPTYDLIGTYAQLSGADVRAVPLTSDYSHDLDAMLARCDRATGLVYICNPNNPTGTLTRRQDLEMFLRKLPATTSVLIDEAYHHYAGQAIDSRTNFVMLNTARPAVEVIEHFRKHNVLIPPPIPTFDNHIRVSLGTPAEMQEFWRVWDLMPGHKMSTSPAVDARAPHILH